MVKGAESGALSLGCSGCSTATATSSMLMIEPWRAEMAAEEEMVTKLAIFLVRRNVTSARLEKIVLLLALKYLPINRGEVCLR